MKKLKYHFGNQLDLDHVIELYSASTLGERRPIDDREIMADMLRHANLVVTAWDGNRSWELRGPSPIFPTSHTWPIWPCGSRTSAKASASS